MISKEDLIAAYYDCCYRKRSSLGYREFVEDEVKNLNDLYDSLVSQTWKPGSSIAFCVEKPKLREVFAAPFRDRIVHHLIRLKFGETFEAVQVPESYSCREGRGNYRAVRHLKADMCVISDYWTSEAWVLKCDLKGFFMSIKKDILWEIVSGIIKIYHGDDPDLPWWEWLIKEVIYDQPEKHCVRKGKLSLWDQLPADKSLFSLTDGVGLPIGNLTSQMFANLYMTPFDWWATKILKLPGYVRYVDDFVAVSKDKSQLLRFLHDARIWLKENLRITLHPKKVYLQEVKKGVKFLGYVIKPGRLYAGNQVVYAFRKAAEKMCKSENPEKYIPSVNSYLGILRHTWSYGIRWEVFASLPWDKLGPLGWRVSSKKLQCIKKWKKF